MLNIEELIGGLEGRFVENDAGNEFTDKMMLVLLGQLITYYQQEEARKAAEANKTSLIIPIGPVFTQKPKP